MGVRSANIVLLLHCTITMVWLRSVLASLTLMVLVVLVVRVVLVVLVVFAGPREPDN